jgi:hypothetical protein
MPTWVRCRDRETGHEFDLAPEDIRIADDSVEVLKDYPEVSGLTAQPRPPKHRVDKAGQSANQTPPAEPSADETAGTSAKKKESN